MRKLRAIFILLVSVFLLLALSSCEGKSVVRLYVNDEMHAIAEYSDGTTEDLGYVGVEVEKEVEVKVEVLPPKYTVTFLDIYGQTIKAEKVYKGDGATAPQAPEIKDKSFDRWDIDFSVVTGDITQIDLPDGKKSGIKDAMSILKNVDDIAIMKLTSKDVVRHKLVQAIINAYEKYEDSRKKK